MKGCSEGRNAENAKKKDCHVILFIFNAYHGCVALPLFASVAVLARLGVM